jgi:lysozyme
MTSGEGARSVLGQDRMRPRYKVSRAGVELIERFEGYRARSARLSDGRWTIGYGHTRSAREGAEVSQADARILLKYVDLPPVEDALHELVTAPLSQNQYDALVAFVFNIGVEAFRESEVLTRLNEGRATEAACALELWRRAEVAGDPVVLDALIRRRAAEKALFLASPEGAAPTPSPLVKPELDARAAEGLPRRRPVEHQAPLSGETAEVRLVAPFEVEPPLEAPTAFTPEPVESPEPEAAAVEATPTAFAPEPVAEAAESVEPAPTETTPTAFAPEPAAETAEAPAAEGQEAPVEEAPTAWTTQVITFAAPSEAPTAWSAPAEAPPSDAASEAEAPTAWTAEATPEAPTAWSPPEAEAVAPVELAPEPAVAVEPAPAVEDGAPETAADEAPVTWLPIIPGPPPVRTIPAAEPAPTRALPASEPPPVRPVYSNYGPMAFAVRPPELRVSEPTTAPEGEGEGGEEAADAEPHPAPSIQASVSAPEAPVLGGAGAAPVVTAAAEAPPPLVLTAPPTDWEEHRAASPAMVTALAAEADELETPLFDEGWDGPSALSGRIVRHEPAAEPEAARKPVGATAPYVLLGLVGFVAFAGALFAFWRGHAPGAAGNPTVLAWALALIGAACVGVSVYFLLKRLGGAED